MTNFINASNLPEEEWMTTEQVQAFFKISKTTLWRWNQTQQLPRTLIGGTHYYPKQFIQKLMLDKLKLPPYFNLESPSNTAAASDTTALDSDVSDDDVDTQAPNQPTQPD